MGILQYINQYDSPLGAITLAGDGEKLTGLWFNGQKYFGSTLLGEPSKQDLPVFRKTREWLDLYFQGIPPAFTPEICLLGSPFRQKVWEVLRKIPYGETMTYGQIAALLFPESPHKSMYARAVGGAVAHNPISIIIPCHRVTGSGGRLTGYAGGVERKTRLLHLEQLGLQKCAAHRNS